ncbi:transposase [Peribacillus saganii]|uniref:Transposase n=1 Tax=Peribacillus saganii TaxID=2303992 RepID=A0A372LJY2_9BACI|nr:transposase [Peribacillus saganii]RFU66336.1 transposase [Peribacillus saganii]
MLLPREHIAPIFQPYNNHQVQVIFEINELLPSHHAASLIDEMVESIPNEKLFSHYSGGGRTPFHPKNDAKGHPVWLFLKGLLLP